MRKLLSCFGCFLIFCFVGGTFAQGIKKSEISKIPKDYQGAFKKEIKKVIAKSKEEAKIYPNMKPLKENDVVIKWIKKTKIKEIDYFALTYIFDSCRDCTPGPGSYLVFFAKDKKEISTLIESKSFSVCFWEKPAFVDLTGDSILEVIFSTGCDIGSELLIYSLNGKETKSLPIALFLFGDYPEETSFIYEPVQRNGKWKIVVMEEDYNAWGKYSYCVPNNKPCYKRIERGEYFWNGKKFIPIYYKK